MKKLFTITAGVVGGITAAILILLGLITLSFIMWAWRFSLPDEPAPVNNTVFWECIHQYADIEYCDYILNGPDSFRPGP